MFNGGVPEACSHGGGADWGARVAEKLRRSAVSRSERVGRRYLLLATLVAGALLRGLLRGTVVLVIVLARGRALEAGAALGALQGMARRGRASGVGGVGAAVGRGRGLRSHASGALSRVLSRAGPMSQGRELLRGVWWSVSEAAGAAEEIQPSRCYDSTLIDIQQAIACARLRACSTEKFGAVQRVLRLCVCSRGHRLQWTARRRCCNRLRAERRADSCLLLDRRCWMYVLLIWLGVAARR